MAYLGIVLDGTTIVLDGARRNFPEDYSETIWLSVRVKCGRVGSLGNNNRESECF